MMDEQAITVGDEYAMTPEERERQYQEQVDRLQVFGQTLDGLFKEQVSQKSKLEERWLKDIRQYNAEYEPETLDTIRRNKGSEAFVNLTRVKCNSAESRLSEMLLPTDDRNWSIEPTPIPQLQKLSKDETPVIGPDGQQMQGETGQPLTVKDVIAKEKAQAEEACALMQQEMDDQLAEGGYNAVLRRVIHYQVVYGTGVLKGPVIRSRVEERFDQVGDSWELQMTESNAPSCECVSPWDFFPDMRATTMDEAEFVFQRHRMTRKDIRALAKLEGFIPEQIKKVLETEPTGNLSGLIDQADSEAMQGLRSRARYEVIEYNGPVKKEDLIAAGVDVDADDALMEYGANVWLVNGTVIKAVPNMLDSEPLMYDAVPFERDDSSIFGFGVPHLMRHSQAVGNASWRMIIDNARLSIGPQIVWRKGKVSPANNDYTLAPLKGWEVTDPTVPMNDAFAVFPIMPNFQGMFEIFNTVRQLTDEETGLPMIAQGQQAPGITKTAQGMTILMNSANTVLRRLIKEFDDSITRRFLKRLYQWNMQYSARDDIKGDFHVIALGSSSLMVREQQAQQLMQLAGLAAQNPEFARRTKWGELYSKITQAMSLNSEGVIRPEAEIKAEDEQAAQQPPQMPPELQVKMAEIEIDKANLQIKQAESQHKMQMEAANLHLQAQTNEAELAQEREKVQLVREQALLDYKAAIEDANARRMTAMANREIALIRVAAEERKTVEQIRSNMGLKAMDIDSKHQLANAEFAVKRAMGSGI